MAVRRYTEAGAEEGFGPETDIGEVSVRVNGLGEVWFRGKIDRIDVVDGESAYAISRRAAPNPTSTAPGDASYANDRQR